MFGPEPARTDSPSKWAMFLWQLLDWATANTPELATPRDREDHAVLYEKVQRLRNGDAETLIKAHLPVGIYGSVRRSFQDAGRLDLVHPPDAAPTIPYISELPPAVGMFGRVSPDLTAADVTRLRDALIASDRTRAKRIAHASGRWANPGIEQRANAFAAYLLMPRNTLSAKIDPMTRPKLTDVQGLASELQVNVSALIEHLYNVDMIDDASRVRLTNALQGARP